MTAPDAQPTTPFPTVPPARQSRRTLWWILGGGGVALVLVCGCLGALYALGSSMPAASKASVRSPAPAKTSTSPAARVTTMAPSPSSDPKIASLADRKAAAAVLAPSLEHYRTLFDTGRKIVGTTQYADGNAGLTAMQDPNSAASKFAAWKKQANPDQDFSYMQAFGTADARFTADNEPAALDAWNDHMGQLTQDLNTWVHLVPSYQIRNKTQAELDTAANAVLTDLDAAAKDMQALTV